MLATDAFLPIRTTYPAEFQTLPKNHCDYF